MGEDEGLLWLAAKQAFSVVHELRSRGLDADIDLPRICMVGKQSGGKSSVMEALTRISVPRAAGQCTSCAFEISTRHSPETFNCTVSIRCEVEDNDSKETIVLARTDKPNELSDLLKISQRLLLNKELLKSHWSKLKSASIGLANIQKELPDPSADIGKFSRDVVVVEVRGQDFTDLELIDLPGLIQTVERDENKHLIGLVRDLCASYLQKPNTLIAMCCPFDDDMACQGVRTMAREYDPKGHRTVGILTKADEMKKGTEEEWLAILQNEKFELQNGYFAVRNPAPDELKSAMTCTAAREKEDAFFKDDALGKRLHGAAPDRCGVAKLRDKLASQLCDLIRQELPRLRSKLHKQLSDITAELCKLGDVVQPEVARSRLVALLDRLVQALHKGIEASEQDSLSFWIAVREHYTDLRHACYNARPRFTTENMELDDAELLSADTITFKMYSFDQWLTLWKKLDGNLDAKGLLSSDIVFSSQKAPKNYALKCDWVEFQSTESTFKVIGSHVLAPKHENVRNKLPAGWSDGSWNSWVDDPDASVQFDHPYNGHPVMRTYRWRPVELAQTSPQWPVLLRFFKIADSGQVKFSIPDVQDKINTVKGREISLPGGPACYRASHQIVVEAQQRWQIPATACVDRVVSELSHFAQSVVGQTIGIYPELAKHTIEILQGLLEELQTKTMVRNDEYLERHEGAPDLYTQNDHYLKDSFDNAQMQIRKSIGCTLQMDVLTREERTQLATLAKKAGHDVKDLITLDTRDDAIWSMAAAYAYHKVAFKRVCDHVPRTIDDMLLRAFVRESKGRLMSELKVDDMEADSQRLCSWFQEDVAVARRRLDLQTRVQRQKSGLGCLDQALQRPDQPLAVHT